MGERDGEGLQQQADGIFNGIKQKIQGSDWLNKAREEAERRGKQIGGQIQDLGKNKDVQDAITAGGQIVGGTQVGSIIDKAKNGNWRGAAEDAVKNGGVGNIVTGSMFPQVAVLGIGADAIGGVIAKRQARELLKGDPADVSARLVNSFDSIDGDKNKTIEGKELKEAGSGLGGLLNDDRAVLPIMGKAFSKFAAFDGKDADKGISRADIDLFNTALNDKARAEAISSDSWSGAKWGGGIGLASGLAWGLASSRGNLGGAALKIGARALTMGLVGGGIGYGWSHHSSDSFHSAKKDEAQQMIDWLRKEL